MRKMKNALLFLTGGVGYVGMELIYRGWSHYSMFLAGGSAFLLLGALDKAQPRLKQPARSLVGSGVITTVELAAGLLFNRDYAVWDYRALPLNYHGQICARFVLLWIPVSAAAMALYRRLDRALSAA